MSKQQATLLTVASTLLLVWTGLNPFLQARLRRAGYTLGFATHF